MIGLLVAAVSSRASAPGHPVVVELFTSQGCSSCPPADRLLTELGAKSAGRVVPLAFHVDIWNSTGWTDPFSSAEWTARQAAYAKALGLQTVYTPQAVVDGGTELIGSDAKALDAAIAAAAARPAGQVSLQLQPAAKEVRVMMDVDVPEELRGRDLDLMVAVFETGLVTQVGRGENGGRQLHDDYVVRSLTRSATLKAGGAARTRHAATVALDGKWQAARVGVAAFLQDPRTLAIHGAGARSLAGAAP